MNDDISPAFLQWQTCSGSFITAPVIRCISRTFVPPLPIILPTCSGTDSLLTDTSSKKIILPPVGTGPWSPPSAGCRHCPRRILPPAASGRSGTGPSTAPRARPRWWRGAAAPLRPPRTPPPPQLRPDQLQRRPPVQLPRCRRQRPPPPPGRRSLQRTRKILWCCEYGSPLSLKHLYYYNHFIIFDFKS